MDRPAELEKQAVEAEDKSSGKASNWEREKQAEV